MKAKILRDLEVARAKLMEGFEVKYSEWRDNPHKCPVRAESQITT